MNATVSVIEYQPPQNEKLTILVTPPGPHAYSGWKKLWTLPFRGSNQRVETYAKSNAWESRTANKPPPVKGCIELPFELVMMILDFAAGSFEHHAILTRKFGPHNMSPNVPSHYHLGVYKLRNWADIAMYQVCRESRKTAIQGWGIPVRGSFPFHPLVDTLTLNIDEPGTFMPGRPIAINKNVTRVDIRTTDGTVFTADHRVMRWFAWFTDSSPNDILRLRSNAVDPANPPPMQVISRMKNYELDGYALQIEARDPTGHETMLGSKKYIINTRNQPKLWWFMINS
jgi:hypothetical protein